MFVDFGAVPVPELLRATTSTTDPGDPCPEFPSCCDCGTVRGTAVLSFFHITLGHVGLSPNLQWSKKYYPKPTD